jgi:hypothetical protein
MKQTCKAAINFQCVERHIIVIGERHISDYAYCTIFREVVLLYSCVMSVIVVCMLH